MPRLRSGPLVVPALGVLVALAVAAGVVLAFAGGRHTSRRPVTVPSALRGPYRLFAAFDRPRQASDAIPPTARLLAVTPRRLVLNESRRVYSGPGGTWWLVPERDAQDDVCFLTRSAQGRAAGSCGPVTPSGAGLGVAAASAPRSANASRVRSQGPLTELEQVLSLDQRALRITLAGGRLLTLYPNADGAVYFATHAAVSATQVLSKPGQPATSTPVTGVATSSTR